MDDTLNKLCEGSLELAEKLEWLSQASPYLKELAASEAKKIRRGTLLSEAGLSLIHILGGPKSGKLELVNALSQRSIFAPRPGVPCKMRPTIIINSTDNSERIEFIKAREGLELSHEKVFTLALENLKGTAGDDKEKLIYEHRHITQENMRQWVEGETEASCAIIYLLKSEAPLLNSGAALVITQELFSPHASEELEQSLIAHIAHYLVLQNIYAPVQIEVYNFLSEAMQQPPRPVRAVPTRCMAAVWSNAANHAHSPNEQSLDFAPKIGDSCEKIIPVSWTNAGLASWQVQAKLLPQTEGDHSKTPSNISMLEEALLNDLGGEEMNKAKQSPKELIRSLESLDEKLRGVLKNADTHMDYALGVKQQIKALIKPQELQAAWEQTLSSQSEIIEKSAEQARVQFTARLNAILSLEEKGHFPADWKENSHASSELNKQREAVEKCLAEILVSQPMCYLSDECLLSLTTAESDTLDQAVKLLHIESAAHFKDEFLLAVRENAIKLRPNSDSFTLGALKEGSLLGLGSSNYSHQKCWPYWQSNALRELEERLTAWKLQAAQMQHGHFNTRINALASLILRELEKMIQRFHLKESMATAEQDASSINMLRRRLTPLMQMARKLERAQR